MRQVQGYSGWQIGLHWAVAVLVLGQYLFHDSIAEAWSRQLDGLESAFSPWIAAHVVGGVLILALTLWRLGLRLQRGVPAAPAEEPAVFRALAHIAHRGFYGLLIAMSVSGGMAWFGGIEWAAQAHNVLKVALLALIALHVLAIPVHRFAFKSRVLSRMIHPGT